MNTEKNRIATSAADAASAERAAKAEEDITVYIHVFKTPFAYQGATIETLTFEWGKLTGADHLAIETEMLMRGKTLVTPEFTGDFLCGMAVRASQARSDTGFRLVTDELLKSLPMRDFQVICKKARGFLLHVGS